MSCEQVQPVLAVLALGGPQSEVADDGVAEHLSGCALCRSVQEDFSGTAAVLSRVELYEVVGIPVPDPERAIALVRRRELAELLACGLPGMGEGGGVAKPPHAQVGSGREDVLEGQQWTRPRSPESRRMARASGLR